MVLFRDLTDRVKPPPHQQQCRRNTVERYNPNDPFDKSINQSDIFKVAQVAHPLQGPLIG